MKVSEVLDVIEKRLADGAINMDTEIYLYTKEEQNYLGYPSKEKAFDLTLDSYDSKTILIFDY